MTFPIQLAFHQMDRSEALESAIRERTEKLAKFHPAITNVHVTVTQETRHSNKGPFLVLAVVLMALSLGVGYLATELLRALGLSPQMTSMLFAPVAMVMTAISYATQYPIYRAIIEPRVEEAPATVT